MEKDTLSRQKIKYPKPIKADLLAIKIRQKD
jgi:hypothetical protein